MQTPDKNRLKTTVSFSLEWKLSRNVVFAPYIYFRKQFRGIAFSQCFVQLYAPQVVLNNGLIIGKAQTTEIHLHIGYFFPLLSFLSAFLGLTVH